MTAGFKEARALISRNALLQGAESSIKINTERNIATPSDKITALGAFYALKSKLSGQVGFIMHLYNKNQSKTDVYFKLWPSRCAF